MSDYRAAIANAVERIALIIEPWRDGVALRRRIKGELDTLVSEMHRFNEAGRPSQGWQPLLTDEQRARMKADSHFDPLRAQLQQWVTDLRAAADRINAYLSSPAQCQEETARKLMPLPAPLGSGDGPPPTSEQLRERAKQCEQNNMPFWARQLRDQADVVDLRDARKTQAAAGAVPPPEEPR